MNQYPNQDQDPAQQGQYPNQGQGQSGTQYGGGYGQVPNVPPYTNPQPPYQQGGQPPYQQTPYQQGGQPPYQQPPYQQSGYGQTPYQQTPYQQGSYGQTPYGAPVSQSMDYRYIIAGVGAIVAFIAYFLPFYTYSSTYFSFSLSGAEASGRFFLDLLLALAALVIVGLLLFGNQMFKNPTNPTIQQLLTSLNTKTRTWIYALIGVGAAGVVIHILVSLGLPGSWGIGAWLYLLAMLAVAAGGALFIWQPNKSSTTTTFR